MSTTRPAARVTSGSHSTGEQWMAPSPGTAARYCRTGAPNPAKYSRSLRARPETGSCRRSQARFPNP
jgi:hypothetical protein